MIKKTDRKIRQEIIDVCRKMDGMGMNQGTSGNISVRVDGGILITPSAVSYDSMVPTDIVFLDRQGQGDKQSDNRDPSTEWRFHLDILNSRPDMNVVVHNHSRYATIVSIRRQEIPAVHYMIAATGGPEVRCAKYATYGSTQLSTNACKALDGRSACLLANHGLIAIGPNLAKALWLANEVEVLAQQYVFTTLLGGAKILSDAEIGRVMDKFENYGIRS